LGTKGIITSITAIVFSIIFVSSFSPVYAAPPTVNVVDQGSSVDIIGVDSTDGMGSVLVQGEPVMSSGIQFCFNPVDELVVNHPKANLPATVTVENCNSPPEQTIVCVRGDLSQTAGDCSTPVEPSNTNLLEKMKNLTPLPKVDCAFQAMFEGFPELQLKDSSQTECPVGKFNTEFPIKVVYEPPLSMSVATSTGQAVIISLPNFIDELNTKTIKIDIIYDATGIGTPKILKIQPSNPTAKPCSPVSTSSSIGPNNIATLTENWICHPNPDDEIITIDITDAIVLGLNAVTVTFDTHAIGGDIIPLDTTMVLVAGTQNTAAWMFPVLVSAIGIGIVIARKF